MTVGSKQGVGCCDILSNLLDQFGNRREGSFIADFLHKGDLNSFPIRFWEKLNDKTTLQLRPSKGRIEADVPLLVTSQSTMTA